MPVNRIIAVADIIQPPAYYHALHRINLDKYRRRKPIKVMSLFSGKYLLLEDNPELSAGPFVDAYVCEPEYISRLISAEICRKKKRGALSVYDVMKYWWLLVAIYRERDQLKPRADYDNMAAKRLGLSQSTMQLTGYIARHASPNLIWQIDCGEITVRKACYMLKQNSGENGAEYHTISPSAAPDSIPIPVNDIRAYGYSGQPKDNASIELALDMIDNGMTEPIKVMELHIGGYQVLDGYKRLEAAKDLGWEDIDATVLNADQADRMMDNIINARRTAGRFTVKEKHTLVKTLTIVGRELQSRRIRTCTGGAKARQRIYDDITAAVAAKLDMSSNHIASVRYLTNNAPDEVLRRVDSGELSLRKACRMIINGKRMQIDSVNITDVKPSEQDRIADLEDKAKREFYRANLAEAKIRELEEWQKNQFYHKDSKIDSLKVTVRKLKEKLIAYGDTTINADDGIL